MATEIGTAYLKIMPSAKGMSANLNGMLGGDMERSGSSLGGMLGGKMGAFAMKAFAALAVGDFIKDSVMAGAALEQSMGGIETLYKEDAAKMMQYAEQAYKTSGTSANKYMENVTSFSAGLIASLDGDTSKAADVANMAMVDMSDNANKFGTDIESIQYAYQGFAKQNYTMLDNLKLGYGGTKSEMQRLLADAEKITGIKYDINNLSDVYNAIHVIQGELGVTGTTAKEATETISGSIGMTKAAFEDFKGKLALGEDVYPAMEAMTTSAAQAALNIGKALINVVIGIPTSIYEHREEIKESIVSGVNAAKDWLTNDFPPLIKAKLPGIVQNILMFMWNTFKAYITQFLPWLWETMLSLGKALINAIIAGIKAALSGLWEAIKGIAAQVANALGFTGLATKVKKAFNAVKNAILSPINTAKAKVTSAVNTIKGIFPLKMGKIFSGIKLPHFKISGGKIPWGIAGRGVKPSVDVEWYAKGGIMDGPTLFGGGEAGSEAILPLDPFWARLDRMADSIVNGVGTVMQGVAAGANGDIHITVYAFPGGPKLDEFVVKAYDRGKAKGLK